MPVLRSIESKIEGLFEGVFGRAFRTHVQPIELARKLVKEMDDHRNVSVSRVYVPNEYTVYLSPDDRKQFDGYEEALVGELAGVPRRARAPRALRAPRRADACSSTTDDDLAVGEFGIATRLVAGEGSSRAAPPPPELPVEQPAQTMIYRAPAPVVPDAPPPEPQREVVTLTVAGRKHEVTKPSVVLGRSREADVRVADVNVSRRHAELRQEGAGYWIVDLGSTNGVERQRQAHRPRARARRRPHHARLDGDRVRALAAVVTLLALETDETLLILKIAFLVLLYGFIVLVVRSATKGMAAGAAGEHRPRRRRGGALRAEHGLPPTRLLVVASPELERGQRRSRSRRRRSSAGMRTSGIRLDRDEFASGAPRAHRAAAGRRVGRRPRLDERDVRERQEAEARDSSPRPATSIRIGATELQVQS